MEPRDPKTNRFYPMNHFKLLDKAELLTPVLHHQIREPQSVYEIGEDGKESCITMKPYGYPLKKGQEICLDFGNHYVGYLNLYFGSIEDHPDSPVLLKLRFAETLLELKEEISTQEGMISRSWIQEEMVHIDEFPAKLALPRRYAFRYVKISVLEMSKRFSITYRMGEVMTESMTDVSQAAPIKTDDAQLQQIYKAGIRTLANCMQEVFEDGPKRDRRLWMGDLRLQALANYASFKEKNLVKRCLYLFAGTRMQDGRVGAALYTKPRIELDRIYMYDYALFFTVALEEYLRETQDEEALEDLYEIAIAQIRIGIEATEERKRTAFIDWCKMSKQAAAQAVLVYALPYAIDLAKRRKDDKTRAELEAALVTEKKKAQFYWDDTRRCYLSDGEDAFATQVWMILAEVADKKIAGELLDRKDEFQKTFPMMTPYMRHQYIMALLKIGKKKLAMEEMKQYWGGMLDAGGDTFFEAWNPENPKASPYGNMALNSFCHAWSCTPVYLIQNFFDGTADR